ncbi:protein translocase subunit SecD [Micromonospora sp. WMMD812]|uniref:protein translocase subunit SecD n=1 Tax=Micromonospora sp. WMMD812 TaxID=3015152 RepID=UPI00248C457D|nr:protein translocase subunit SecD [Micromonospora sp. WMMD812]WBB69721.1 protein translocase subunit SecD [Micromonospora sp. WMMD812]
MAPPQGQMRPGRQIAVLGLVFVVLYLLVFFSGGAKGSFTDRLEPRLGLDLIGGTRLTLEAKNTLDGRPPTAENLEEARQIIENRVNAFGVAEAEVVTEGNRNIVISLPGENRDLTNVGSAAELRFRKVLKAADGSGAVAAPAPTPSGSASPAPSGSAAPTPSGSATPSGSPAPKVTSSPTGGQGGMAPAPSATPSASASASASPSAAAPSPSASDEPVSASIEEQRKAVEQKVGAAAWSAASGLQGPADLSADPSLADKLKPFGTLSPEEVAVLPAQMQFNVPTIGCAQLDKRPPASISDPNQQAVACEDGAAKYLLDKAKVLGTDVSDASAVMDQTSSWVVSLDFTGSGQEKWTNLTRESFNNDGQACDASALGQDGKCRVAVVLDNEIVSSPEIQGVLTGDSQITGNFTQKDASDLASQLRYGALPVTFEQQEQQNVSATLGASHLRAGLLAAGIGMLLVIIYAFFYYRLLGSVIFLSLLLSALLVFGALIVLGRQIGFTLTLAGIAGFIVSLGVAADSFVIYFERLKDEIREGRSPRSAVPRAWARARRTIISANTISILAAVVLYVVSVGTVKGFAFALGLATVLDLVVVFLFRHPIMTMFARTGAFLSPRVSGLGRVLRTAEAERDTTTRPSRVKEA